MPQCCVPLCNTEGGFEFPTGSKYPAIREAWIVAVHRLKSNKSHKLWQPKPRSVVCYKHFKESDFTSTAKKRRRLKKNVVPSVFPFKRKCSPHVTDREKRSIARRALQGKWNVTSNVQYQLPISHSSVHNTIAAATGGKSENVDPEVVDYIVPPIMVPDIAAMVEVQSCSPSHTTCWPGDVQMENSCQQETDMKTNTYKISTSSKQPLLKNCKSTQTFSDQIFTIDKYQYKPKAVKYLTGFENYGHFMFVFHVLGDACYSLPIDSHLHPKDQLFLTLMKLRNKQGDFMLHLLFDIPTNLVGRIFKVWVCFMYHQLGELNFYPSKEIVQETMPSNFKEAFPSTRIVIDGTEIPIEKPSNMDAQSATFSTYKNKNTLKALIGITPRGLVSYVSDAYGGSTSDRQICERSPLLLDPTKLESGDSIMADRGFTVQDLFATKNVKVNIPTMLKGKSQLEAADVVRDRRIASKRIHVERVIGLAKTFKILKQELPAKLVPLGNKIITVCFYLTNLKRCIVDRNA